MEGTLYAAVVLEAGGEPWTRPRPVSIVPVVPPRKVDRPLELLPAFHAAKMIAGWQREVPEEARRRMSPDLAFRG